LPAFATLIWTAALAAALSVGKLASRKARFARLPKLSSRFLNCLQAGTSAPTGALTLVPTAPQNVVGFIASVEINRAGDRLYVYEDPHIYGYSITAAGELTALPNMPYNNAGSQFYSMRIDEYDQFLFAMSVSGDQVHVFEILDDGSLQEHIESPIANANPAGVPVQLITVP
jgi:hypothetical protein